ncbi:MAG: DMT family transporter [Proteobacteria bacterium]|nr:DMT family transporter [Pseudomonadota bacterium]
MSLQNWILLIILSVLWGGTFFFIELALVDFTPFTIVFLRVSLAAIALFAYLIISGEKIPTGLGLWMTLAVMGLLNNVVPFSLITWGQTHITGGVASILNATTPLFGVVFAHFLTKDEKMVPNKLVGVLVGFAGILVMMQPTMDEGFSFESLGQIAVLGAALSYGIAIVWGKRLSETSPIVNAFGMLFFSSIVLLPTIFIVEEPLSLTPTLLGSVSVLGLAVLGTAIAYLMFFRILASAGAVNLTLVTFLIPVSALILGIGILGEKIHPMALYGMLVIFAGLAIIDGRILGVFKKRKAT